MHLLCKGCGESQPVTFPDEADEDPRTRTIRQAFRAQHLQSCGAGAVSLVLREAGLPLVDPETWARYLADRRPPPDVALGADGFFSRTIIRDGKSFNVRVCEDCWLSIPRYVDFPFGLTSPESDGEAGAVPKARAITVETTDPNRAGALEHLRKAVCLPCYLVAYARVYPDAPLPVLSDAVVGDGTPVTPPPEPPEDAGNRVPRMADPMRDEVAA